MELTKYGHSCIRVDEGARGLAIDPGVFSDVPEALDGASAVLITHEHSDHIDADTLRLAAGRDSRLRIYAPAPVAKMLADLGEQVVTVGPGESFEAGGFPVRTFGGQHALIHPTIPIVANLGYLIEETVYHPGDSLIVPPVPVSALLAPMNAPWSKVSEVIDFVVSVRAPIAVGIHDALLTDAGRGIVEGHLTRIGAEHGVEYRALATGDQLTL
jgi:L-ascorbate metabolism protein UlaG (beta-lactamase superfamily)